MSIAARRLLRSGWRPAFPGDQPRGLMYYGCSLGSQETIDNFETRVGFTAGVYREYYQATQVNTMVSNVQAWHAKNRLPIVSIKAPIVGTIDQNWQAVANGSQDAWLNSIASGLGALTKPVWFCIHHEPRGDGTQANYRAMYSHAIPILHQAKNLAVMPILNGYSFDINDPASGWVTGLEDIVGVDYYNQWWTYDTNISVNLDGAADNHRPWKTVDTNFNDVITEVDSWGKRVVFAEHGCHYAWNEPGKAAAWIDASYDYCLSRGVLAMSYFNSAANSPRGSWDLEQYTVIPPTNTTNYVPNNERYLAFQANTQKPGNAHIA